MNQNEPKYFFEKAVAMQEACRYEDSVHLCTAGLALDPRSIEGLQLRGMGYYHTRDLKKSLQDFEQLLQLDPNNQFAHLRNVVCHGELGDLDASLESLRLYHRVEFAVRMSHQDEQELLSLSSRGHVDLASRLLDAGRTSESLEVFDLLFASDITPDDVPVAFIMVMENANCETALKYFKSIEERIRLTGEQGLGLSRIAAEFGNDEAAEYISNQTLKNNPHDWDCCVQFGWKAFQDDDITTAEELLRRAVLASPSNADSIGLLAWVLASKCLGAAKNKESLQLAMALQDLDGYPPHKKLKILANSEASNGLSTQAASTLEKVIELAPDEDVRSILLRIKKRW